MFQSLFRRNARKSLNTFFISHLKTFKGIWLPVKKIIIHPSNRTCSGFSNLALLQTSISLRLTAETETDTNYVSIIPDNDFFKNSTPDQIYSGVCFVVSWVLSEEKEGEEVSVTKSYTQGRLVSDFQIKKNKRGLQIK